MLARSIESFGRNGIHAAPKSCYKANSLETDSMYSVLKKRGAIMVFKEQAESCRRQAVDFLGRPEAPFLLSVARAFDELADRRDPPARSVERLTSERVHA